MNPSPTVGDLVSVAEVDTVVRLDSEGLLGELVPTGDVENALAQIIQAASGATGRALFVVGPFGSGKSHLLAAAGELLSAPEKAPARWPSALSSSAAQVRRSLAVKVPLVEYRAEVALEDVVRERSRRALGLDLATGGADRSEHFDLLLAHAKESGSQGVAFLLDELSEWLRAKRATALTEDLRFLQFLGEWSRQRPVVVLAALQESIEEVANVSEKELTRIRDRYQDLRLSMRHVEDLVRGRLVQLRPGAEAIVEQVARQSAVSFPGASFDLARMARCYPLHPATLDLLEGMRFLLSQNRGVVDFVCRQVRLDLGAPSNALVTPERIWGHFSERLAERHETARLAAAVVPYYERAVKEMFDEQDARTALRTVELLCLISASPLERPRTAAELAGMLLTKVSETDPAANVAYLEQVVLGPLVARGAYVLAYETNPATYAVRAEADAAVALEALLGATRAELNDADRRMVTTLLELGSSPKLPLAQMQAMGNSKRELMWQNTRRYSNVALARVAEWSPDDVAKCEKGALAAGAEAALVLAEVELSDASELSQRAALLASSAQRVAFWVPTAPSASELESLAELHSRRLVRAQAASDGRFDLVELLERSRDSEAARAREILARLYFSGSLVSGTTGGARDGAPGTPDLPSLAGLSFDNQLPRLIAPLFARLHPLHAQVAPQAELAQRHVQTLLNDFVVEGRLGTAAMQRGDLKRLVELYLVPLGVARSKKDGVAIAPDPARSPAVAELMRLVGEGDPVPGPWLMAALADGQLGLTEPEALLLLNACARAGLVERWRAKKKMAEIFSAVTTADSFGTGELVEQSLREAVAALAPAITGPGPFEPWTSATQRDAWQRAQVWLGARKEDAAQVRSGIDRLDDFPALAAASTSLAQKDLRVVEAVVEACMGVATPAEGLRALVGALSDIGPGPLQESSKRLSALGRFFRDELRRVNDDASYLTHPELTMPETEEELFKLRSAALALLPEVLVLASQDRTNELTNALREFRSAYVAVYQEAHDRHYSAVSPRELERIRREGAYQALAALSGVGALAVPDGLVKVERMLSGSVPSPCGRRVASELAWKPRCSCGFSLGDPLPALDPKAVLEVAERGVRQQLGELAEAATSQRLSEAANQLEALGRAELASDLRALGDLASDPAAADPLAVASLAGTELQQVLNDILSGNQLIVTRDLAALREDLIGRRYTKRRLVELLSSWADPAGNLPPVGFIEVVDSSEAAGGASGTAGFLKARFPSLARVLPALQAADAFWLAAWWAGRPDPPKWVPHALLEAPGLAQAAEAARGDTGALGELADLDSRCGPGTVLGGQVERALGLSSRPLAEVARCLGSERLFRYPVALAADQAVRRLANDWQGIGALEEAGGLDLARLASEHSLISPEELDALGHLVEAARHLAEAERRLPAGSCAELVEKVYAEHLAPVASLVSRASLATAGRSVLSPEPVEVFRAGARRLMATADSAFSRYGESGFPGCLLLSEVGETVVKPLLEEAGKVAVVVVDAMRADAGRLAAGELSRLLPGRHLHWHWAVVPEPTRTTEAMAALALGRPVPAGSLGGGPGRWADANEHEPALRPFEHLGYEVALLRRADRDHNSIQLRELWASPSPVMVAVASALDERLHHSSLELAVLVDDAVRSISQRVFASLSALAASVPVVLLADHGFRENPSWGKGPEGRYVHGGTSLEECVVPVIVASA